MPIYKSINRRYRARKPVEFPVSDSSLPANPAAPAVHKNPKTESVKRIASTTIILLIAPVLALTITAYLFQSYEVDGPSMETTLSDNDRLIIWKAPHTWARITNHPFIPNRGDVIVFKQRGLPGIDPAKERQLIKRVIGLPGDRVTVNNGNLTVYNSAHPDGFKPDKTLPYGIVIEDTGGDNIDVDVKQNELFVCGDNRANSLDSRIFGVIQSKDIVGKLVVRLLPLGNIKKF